MKLKEENEMSVATSETEMHLSTQGSGLWARGHR